MQSLFGLGAEKMENPQPQDLTLQMDANAFIENGKKYTCRLLETLAENRHISREGIEMVIPSRWVKDTGNC